MKPLPYVHRDTGDVAMAMALEDGRADEFVAATAEWEDVKEATAVGSEIIVSGLRDCLHLSPGHVLIASGHRLSILRLSDFLASYTSPDAKAPRKITRDELHAGTEKMAGIQNDMLADAIKKLEAAGYRVTRTEDMGPDWNEVQPLPLGKTTKT